MAQNSFFENGKIGKLIRIYGQILLGEKQKGSYMYRMTSKKFGFFHESYVTAVAMTTTCRRQKYVKVAQNSFFENGKIGKLIRIYGQILLGEKQKGSYMYRMTSKKFGFFHESYATAVAMTTMTFQNGGYFDFRAI